MDHLRLPTRSKKLLILNSKGSREPRESRERLEWALKQLTRRNLMSKRKSSKTRSMLEICQVSITPLKGRLSLSQVRLRLKWTWLVHSLKIYLVHRPPLIRAKERASTLSISTTRQRLWENINNSKIFKARQFSLTCQLWHLSINSKFNWERITRIEPSIRSPPQEGILSLTLTSTLMRGTSIGTK